MTLVRKTGAEGHLGNGHSASGKQLLRCVDPFALAGAEVELYQVESGAGLV